MKLYVHMREVQTTATIELDFPQVGNHADTVAYSQNY